ncbi:C45 family autoproteolytic acyltransferase/hydrolase [Sporosarcina sp. CAU 1771]
MKILNLSGSPFEIGFGHGEKAKSEVAFSIEAYEKLFYNKVGITWDQAKEMGKKHLDAIEKTNIDLIEEMQGVAKGASVDFEDILVLNARSEIVLTQNKTDGCTSFAIMPPKSEYTFLGQTWDWTSAQAKSLLMMKIKQQNGPAIQMVTEAGIIGKIGLNEHGLGVCLNALRSNIMSNKLPIHLGLREVLNSENIEEARSKVINGKLGSSANFLIAQANGTVSKAINLELSPNKFGEKQTENAYLYHTNHYCSKAVIEDVGIENLSTDENSYDRIERIGELIKNSTKNNNVVQEKDIEAWLSDHKNTPSSICIHKEPGTSDYTDIITVFSVIMNLTDKSMYLKEGQPCQPINKERFTFDF